MITLGTMCSGIGLIDLGLERAGLGPVLWQVEILPERRAVLAHHWPNVPRFEDVRTLKGNELPYVDCIAFGSPCKNLSAAGDRSGLDGASSRVFFDCLRVVSEVRPRWVIFENVASGATLWVDRVVGELAKFGYASLPIPLAASDCGAPHERKRVFLIAYTDQHREHARTEYAEMASPSQIANVESERWAHRAERRRIDETQPRSSDNAWGPSPPDFLRVVHGSPVGLDGANQRISALGDSCTPPQAEVIGHVVRMLEERRREIGVP